MFDHPVVLGVEDVVDGGQADVLIDAAVPGDEVPIKQFIVVDARRRPPEIVQSDRVIGIGGAIRRGKMGNIGEEHAVGADSGRQADPLITVRGGVALDDNIVRGVRNTVGTDARDA